MGLYTCQWLGLHCSLGRNTAFADGTLVFVLTVTLTKFILIGLQGAISLLVGVMACGSNLGTVQMVLANKSLEIYRIKLNGRI